MIDRLVHFEDRAERARATHEMFSDAMFGVMQSEMHAPDAMSPASIARLRQEAHEAGWQHFDAMRERVAQDMSETSQKALRDALTDLGYETSEDEEDAPTQALSDAVETYTDFLTGEIAAQINRDVVQVIKSQRNMAINAQMAVQSRGISLQAALNEVMIDAIDLRRRMWFTDRAGRRIASSKHIRRTWRANVRDLYVVTYMLALAEFGERDALIWHEVPTHAVFGTVLSLDNPAEIIEIHDEIFHPNSRALPVARAAFEEF